MNLKGSTMMLFGSMMRVLRLMEEAPRVENDAFWLCFEAPYPHRITLEALL
jgi:hypothetical protein